jgi:hypothetical protein
MAEVQDPRSDDAQYHGMLLGGCVSRNGVDASALRRAHMRELTMARQAAERRQARPPMNGSLDRPAQLAAAQERAIEYRAELARIDADHKRWLQEHGEDQPEPLPRYLKQP